jgi:hypothetical protein
LNFYIDLFFVLSGNLNIEREVILKIKKISSFNILNTCRNWCSCVNHSDGNESQDEEKDFHHVKEMKLTIPLSG